uniref:Uncharacterized protein n=1 Tax=Rhizophora mucronata TaxID=61149 RepID=A0A2P2LYP2_RHIMU
MSSWLSSIYVFESPLVAMKIFGSQFLCWGCLLHVQWRQTLGSVLSENREPSMGASIRSC